PDPDDRPVDRPGDARVPDATSEPREKVVPDEPAGTTEPTEPESYPPRGPQSLLAAVKLMYVGAGLQALSIVFTFAARVQLRDQMAAQQPSLTSAEIETALNFHLMRSEERRVGKECR